MDNKIKKRVRGLMQDYKVSNKRLENGLILACNEEYESQIAKGIENETAFNSSVTNVETALKQNFIKKNKYVFSLTICCIALFVSIIEMIVPLFYKEAQYFYSNEMPVVILALCIGLIYTAINWRKYRWYDFVILGIYMLSYLPVLILIELFGYIDSRPGCFAYAEYVFPCIIRINKVWNSSTDFMSEVKIYDFNFILSFILAAIIITFTVKKALKSKRKLSCEDKSTDNESFIERLNGVIKENAIKENKFVFSLSVCCCALFMSLFEIIIIFVNAANELLFSLITAFSLAVLITFLLNAIIKRKEFKKFDFIVLAVLIAVWLMSLIQICVYSFKNLNADLSVSSYYIFPCKINFSVRKSDSFESIYTANAYDFNFLTSAVLTVVTAVFAIKEKLSFNKKITE